MTEVSSLRWSHFAKPVLLKYDESSASNFHAERCIGQNIKYGLLEDFDRAELFIFRQNLGVRYAHRTVICRCLKLLITSLLAAF